MKSLEKTMYITNTSMKNKRDYFKELNKALDNINKVKNSEVYLGSIADKVAWCYKWKKITSEEKDILCDRVIELWKIV